MDLLKDGNKGVDGLKVIVWGWQIEANILLFCYYQNDFYKLMKQGGYFRVSNITKH